MNQPRDVPSTSTLCLKAFQSSLSPRKPGKTPQSGIQGLPTNQHPSLFNKAPTHSSPPRSSHFTPSLHPAHTPLFFSLPCQSRWRPPSDFFHLVSWALIYPSPPPAVSLQMRTSDFHETADQIRTVSPWLLRCVPQCPASCCIHSTCEINIWPVNSHPAPTQSLPALTHHPKPKPHEATVPTCPIPALRLLGAKATRKGSRADWPLKSWPYQLLAEQPKQVIKVLWALVLLSAKWGRISLIFRLLWGGNKIT